MFARIIGGQVAELTEEYPTLASGECAHIEEVFDWEVQPGWTWTPDGFSAPPAPDPNAEIDAQIAALEAQQTPRRIRDAALTAEGKAWLQNLEDQIAALRTQRVQPQE